MRNPVRAAAHVLKNRRGGPGALGRVPPILVVGEGARQLAEEAGLETTDGNPAPALADSNVTGGCPNVPFRLHS